MARSETYGLLCSEATIVVKPVRKPVRLGTGRAAQAVDTVTLKDVRERYGQRVALSQPVRNAAREQARSDPQPGGCPGELRMRLFRGIGISRISYFLPRM